MNGFLYTLTLEEPVLANSSIGDTHSASNLFYIPGSTIRGAFIQSYSEKKDAADQTFRRLFLNGETCYLNAYPMIGDTRALPIPLRYHAPIRSSYFGKMMPNKIIALREIAYMNIHAQREAEIGAASSQMAVYWYTALPAGMRLQGIVLAQSATDAWVLRSLIDGESILLGKGRSAGYGRVLIITDDLPDNWRESEQPFTAEPGSFTLTFLSPAIVRDENGQFSLDIQNSLEAHLGTDVKIAEAFRRPEFIGGFNRTWGLPLPQTIAIAAGSSFEVLAEVPSEKLRALEASGIGERRAEGFGRVAANLVLPRDDSVWEMVDIELASVAASTLSPGDSTARLMISRLLRRELDEKVIQAARAITNKYTGRVPNNHILRWRKLLREVLAQRDIVRVQNFCKASRNTPSWKRMQKVRVWHNGTSPRLSEWIEFLLASPTALYQSLGVEAGYQLELGPNSIGVDELNTEYRLRLLETVLSMIQKQHSEGDVNA